MVSTCAPCYRMVSVTGTTTWAVKSAESSQEYTVNLEQEQCTQDCALECTLCNICVHMYSCACCDYLIHGTICKHIHLVARTTSAEPMKATPPTLPVEDKEVILQALRQPPSSTPSHHCLLAKLDDLQTLIRGCTNAEALSAAEKHITAAVSVLKAPTSEAGVGVLPKAPCTTQQQEDGHPTLQINEEETQVSKGAKYKASHSWKDVLLWSPCMSVVYISCLYSHMRHSCLFTCEGVVSKAFSRGEG